MTFGKKIVSGLLWGQIGMAGRSLICFAVSILVARSLGAEIYGIYAALISLIYLMKKFTDIGTYAVFSTYIPRFLSRDRAGECSYVVRNMIAIRIAIIVVAAVILNLCSGPAVTLIGDPSIADYLILTSVWFVIRGITDGFTIIVMATVRMKFFSAVEIAISVVQLTGVLVLMQFGMSLNRLILLMLAVNGIQMICYAIGSVDTVRPKPEKTQLMPIIKFGIAASLSNLLQYFKNRSIDIFMILHFLNDSASVAYYDVAFLIVFTGGTFFLSSIENLTLPIISEAHSRYGDDGLRSSWELLTKLSIFLAAPIFVFFIAHANSIVTVFYTDAYAAAAPIIVAYSIFSVVGLFLAHDVSESILLPLNRERLYLGLRAFNGILNIMLNIILIPRIGVMGAVIATGGSSILTNVIELVIAMRVIKARLPLGFIARFSMILAVSISWTLAFEPTRIWSLAATAIAYAVATTWLMFRICGFSDTEKRMIQDVQPGLYNLLTRLSLIR